MIADGAREDYEQEQIDLLEQAAHEHGECKGAPRCGYCVDEAESQLEDMKEDRRFSPEQVKIIEQIIAEEKDD